MFLDHPGIHRMTLLLWSVRIRQLVQGQLLSHCDVGVAVFSDLLGVDEKYLSRLLILAMGDNHLLICILRAQVPLLAAHYAALVYLIYLKWVVV